MAYDNGRAPVSDILKNCFLDGLVLREGQGFVCDEYD